MGSSIPAEAMDRDGKPVTKLKLTEPLVSFPSSILALTHLTHLDLSGTGLSSLPTSINALQNLKIAFFSGCNFKTFPSELSGCPDLEMVAFRSNGMTTIPEDSFPPRLRWLILTDNAIESLPRSIGKCERLQKCMLSGNVLTSLPEEMKNCQKLGLLRLSANRLTTLPDWLFEMPELAFLSFAGNPTSSATDIAATSAPGLAEVPWTDLTLASLLGEGASGIISKGTWNAADQSHDVAIKLFKGAVTSDGTPMDEMRACIRAGSHANLIDPLGKIHNHPDPAKHGLVMQLIPPTYSTLGLPPSLESCTRDCFSPAVTLTTLRGLGILQGIAAAAGHLHAQGIAHGDLYAHNILHDETGHALLGDFGAASIYAGASYRSEPLEVLAFAHLIEDIWSLIRPGFNEAELSALLQLKALHTRCASVHVAARPAFDEIRKELEAIEHIGTVAKGPSGPLGARRPSVVGVQA